MAKALRFLIVIFIVAFPKGGFKIAGVPLTWGYLLLFVSIPAAFFGLIYARNRIYIPKERRLAIILTLPFIIFCCIKMMFITGYENSGFFLAFVLSYLAMPFLFLFIFNREIDQFTSTISFRKLFVNCIRVVTVFGLFLFVYKVLTGVAIEIPYLTVNIDDYGSDATKFNNRGLISKLASTYNNGNIFGICMLILLPMYVDLESKFVFKTLIFLALALTLSRTVWFGMGLYSILQVTSNLNRLRGWITLLVVGIVVVIFLPLVLSLMEYDLSFIFDKNLGGRSDQLGDDFGKFSIFGSSLFTTIGEIVYASIWRNFGAFGMLLFIFYLNSSIISLYIYRKALALRDHAYWGLLIFPLLCLSDGATLFIPTMAFFWFVSSYSLMSKRSVISKSSI